MILKMHDLKNNLKISEMTLPLNSVFDEESKKYLKKSMFWSKIIGLAGFLVCAIILIVILNQDRPKKQTENPETLRELRNLNNSVIAAKDQQEVELRKLSDSTKIETAKTRSDLKIIKTDLNSIKRQRDEKISAIHTFQSPDIISAFSDIERQYNASK